MLTRRSLYFAPFAAMLGKAQSRNMFGNAEAYERFMGRWSRLVAPLLVEFAGLPSPGRILDVGSGTGSLAFAIVQQRGRAHVVGIDPSKEYVAYAASRNQSPDRATFEVGDAQRLQFPDASFDAAASLLVFNFIPDPGQALSELCRVTRPGGTIAAAVWDYGGRMVMLRRFWDAAVATDPSAVKRDERNMPLCRSGELGRLWSEARLENVREQAIEVTTHFSSFTDYWDSFLLGQGPAGAYVAQLPPERRVLLRDEVKKRLSLTDDNTAFDLPARVWAVRGRVTKPA